MLLLGVRDTIRQGFSWAAREGPLCEERELLPISKIPLSASIYLLIQPSLL